MDTLNFTVKRSAGADNLDLNDTTIEYQSDAAQQTLSHSDSGPDGTTFGTEYLKGDTDDVLDNTSERIKITIDLTSGDLTVLPEGGEATVRFVDQSGATTIYGVNVPDTISGETFVEV